MDQGVIQHTRKIYRHHLLERMLLCFDNGKEYSIDLLGATCVIVHAWRQVEPTLAMRCFEHDGFSKESTVNADTDYSRALDEEGAEYCDRINAPCAEIPNPVQLASPSIRTLKKIDKHATQIWSVKLPLMRPMCDHSDNGGSNKPFRAPALGEVIESLNVIRSFVECYCGNSEMLHVVGQLEIT
nr:tigger transposable element-derived protein 4-like [Dermacentor andersoni]